MIRNEFFYLIQNCTLRVLLSDFICIATLACMKNIELCQELKKISSASKVRSNLFYSVDITAETGGYQFLQ